MALKLGTLRGPQALAVYLIGLVACFVGERLIGGEDSARWVVSGLGLAAVVVACLLLLLAWLGSDLNARRVERRAFLLGLTGLLALALYLLSSDLVWGPQAVVAAEQQGPGLRAALQVLWPIVLFCSLLPLIFLQWSLASMGRGRGVELGRVRASTLAAGSLAMLLCTLFLVNAVVDHEDVHVDLSYFKTTSPSEASLELVAGLDEPTRALLFFPEANEVLAEVAPYFRALADASERFSLEVVDRALQPERAREYRVGRAGAVVLERGGSHRKIELGVDLDRAKRKLRKLDEAFQESFFKLAYKREVIYLVSGHGERGRTQRQEDARAGIGVLRRALEGANFTVKRLDAVGGLSQAVPDDAAMLLWAGPGEPLFPGEMDALRRYLTAGGRMLLLLDPEGEHQPDALLGFLGLTYDRARLAHEQAYLPAGPARSVADRYNLVTNKFSNHAATDRISRYARELPVAVPTTGSLGRAKDAGQKNRITFLVRSLPNTWADEDGDGRRADAEPARVFQLAAAVSRRVGPAAEADQPADPQGVSRPEPEPEPEPDEEKKQMRVVVFADADVFADQWFGFRGNRYLLADGLRWLLDEERVTGAATSEEDKPVAHTHAEDVWWFYGTVFAVPLLILGLGWITGWGRGRRRGDAP